MKSGGVKPRREGAPEGKSECKNLELHGLKVSYHACDLKEQYGSMKNYF
jgi:hypothetical protein